MNKFWSFGAILTGIVLIYGGWTGSYLNVWDALKNRSGPATETARSVGTRTGA